MTMHDVSDQLRQNPLTEQWVIYAPARSSRPGHPQKPSAAAKDLPEHDPDCPFCPGNEAKLPEIIAEHGPEQHDEWFTRVVPNKYPALQPDQPFEAEQSGFYAACSAFGRHEVIIDTPFHNRDLPLLSVTQITHLLDTYLDRSRSIRDPLSPIKTVVIFRNHGTASGTSLMHPHSQLIAVPVVPKFIRDKQAVARRYFRQNHRCLLCDLLNHEKQSRQRCIYENDSFLAFVPFAAEVPFEVWLVPKRHDADFGSVDESQTNDLAVCLKNILSAFCDRLGDPAYNYIIHSHLHSESDAACLHWYLQIRPRTTTPAGFEIGSGMLINPSLPEDNAARLKIDNPTSK